jgi:tetratricopeptide (TPR) repeat protein
VYLFSLITLLTLGNTLLETSSVEARKPGVAGEAEVKAGRFADAVSKLEAADLKGADEYYLLGKAYMGLGKKTEAFKAWTETLHINEGLSKRKKWTFLFPPKKRLKGT